MNEEINKSVPMPDGAQAAPAEEPTTAAPTPPAEEATAATPMPEDGDAEDGAAREAVDYERLAAEDLAEIKRLDPAYAPATHLGELPFARRFAELRDLGLSVKEALAAAAPRFEREDGRAHLRAVAPRGARVPEGNLDRDGMKQAKLLFGNLSEGEINALYRRVTRSGNH